MAEIALLFEMQGERYVKCRFVKACVPLEAVSTGRGASWTVGFAHLG
jgi:hypothetical protein